MIVRIISVKYDSFDKIYVMKAREDTIGVIHEIRMKPELYQKLEREVGTPLGRKFEVIQGFLKLLEEG